MIATLYVLVVLTLVVLIEAIISLFDCRHQHTSRPIRKVGSTNRAGDEYRGYQFCFDCQRQRSYTIGLPESQQGPWHYSRKVVA